MPRPFFARWGKAAWKASVPLLILFGCVAWATRDLWDGAPLSHDHPPHFFKAWHFWTEMLSRGRLRGFSHYWSFGIPADETVGCGSGLWVALFRVATLGLLSWEKTYSIALIGLEHFLAFASYTLTRRYFGKAAGVIAGIASVVDMGDWSQGGWAWTISWGVWPVTLCLALLLMGFAALERLAQTGGARHLLVSALWIGAALITHHLALIVIAVSVPCLLLDQWLRPSSVVRGSALRVAAACALGTALSAFFLLPMLARSADTLDLGVVGPSLHDLGQALVRFETFAHVWPPILILAGVGAIVGLRRNDRGVVFLTTATAAFVLLSSGVLIHDLHLHRVMPSLIKIEGPRMILPAKLLVFSLMGCGIIKVLELGRERTVRPILWRRLSLPALLVALAAPIARPSWRALTTHYFPHPVQIDEKTPHWSAYQAFFDWSRQERRSSSEFYRIAYAFHQDDHTSLVAPIFNETLYHKIGYTPGHNFNRIPQGNDPELLEALSVKFVLSNHRLPSANFEFVQSFDTLHLYRFKLYRPEPFTVLGPGKGRLLEFSPEKVRIAVTGASSETRLKLHVARFERWEASVNGAIVPISPAAVFDGHYPFLMEVPVRNGEVVFEYVRRPIDWLGLMISVLALPLFACAYIARYSAPFRRAFDALVHWSPRLIIATIPVLGLAAWQIALGTRTRDRLLPRDSLFQPFPGASLSLGDEPCKSLEPLVYECGNHAHIEASLTKGIYGSHLCLSAPLGNVLQRSVTTEVGRFLMVSFEPVPGPGTVRLTINDELVQEIPVRNIQLGLDQVMFDTRRYAGKRATLELSVRGGALYCFDARVIH